MLIRVSNLLVFKCLYKHLIVHKITTNTNKILSEESIVFVGRIFKPKSKLSYSILHTIYQPFF